MWQALQEPTQDYTVFTHLLDQNGDCCIWQSDVMPRGNEYPTSRWLTDEIVVDSYEINLAPDLQAGAYAIETGLYISETGQRLQIKIQGEDAGDALYLQPIKIP